VRRSRRSSRTSSHAMPSRKQVSSSSSGGYRHTLRVWCLLCSRHRRTQIRTRLCALAAARRLQQQTRGLMQQQQQQTRGLMQQQQQQQQQLLQAAASRRHRLRWATGRTLCLPGSVSLGQQAGCCCVWAGVKNCRGCPVWH
jgi:hypothetical protein